MKIFFEELAVETRGCGTSKSERDSILSLVGEAMTHRLSLFLPLAFLANFALSESV